MATGPTGDRGQKKKRIVTLALMAIFLMSASFFLIDRKEETIIVVSFPNGRELEAEVADTPEKLLVGLAFREALPANGGLLYIFESTGQNHLVDESVSVSGGYDMGRRKSSHCGTQGECRPLPTRRLPEV